MLGCQTSVIVVSYLAPSITNSEETLSTSRCLAESPNAVYLDGVGHNGDSRDAISSDAFRIAAGIAEMKMLDRIEQSDGPSNRNEKPELLLLGTGLCLPLLYAMAGPAVRPW
jgi:hypothetical protein